MKTRVFIVLTLASLMSPVAVLAKETRRASELSTKVNCRESALKEFETTLPQDVKIQEVVNGARSPDVSDKLKVSGGAA